MASTDPHPKVSDFRSDTVTRPTPAMRQAMAEAVVGDDVFGDDPTVRALEEQAAAAFGKEAGLFTPSGTMANLIAMTVHTNPGDEVFVEEYSHCYNNEVGGAAAFAGAVTRTLPSDAGRIDPALVARFARPGDLHQPRTALLCVENTHNFHGGRVVPIELLHDLQQVCSDREIALHLDGARIWNAVVAAEVDPVAYGTACDSLMFCFSKGLGAPVGSMLLGTHVFVAEARRIRKRLGGGMRQVGVLAAAAQLALEEGPAQLKEDHRRARRLAEGLAALPGAAVDLDAVETNIFFLRTEAGRDSYGPIAEALAEEGVLAVPLADLGIRFVTHRDVGDADVDRALTAAKRVLPTLGLAASA